MAAVEMEFTGKESLDEIFEKLPLKYSKKPVISTFRKGAAIFTRTLRRNTPTVSGDTRKAIKVKAGRSVRYPNISAGFRLLKTKKEDDEKMPGYYKALWANSGTLSNRDAEHKFDRARRHVSASWVGGIKPRRFVERSWQSTGSKVQAKIDTELEAQTVKFLKKHAIK